MPSHPGAAEPVARSLDANEHRTSLRAGRSAVSQIRDDRLADIGGQPQPLSAALAAHDDLAATPVDVLQRQARTSDARDPSLASSVRIARSLTPAIDVVSHDPSSRRT